MLRSASSKPFVALFSASTISVGGPALSAELTRILGAISSGKKHAYNELFPLVYAEMRGIARQKMRGERKDVTLGATALVHEAYLKLLGNERIVWRDRAHFFAAAAESMRRILIDHARKRNAPKHGGDRRRVPLHLADLATSMDHADVLALEEALEHLKALDGRMYQIVMLRFYAGLSVADTAAALAISARTVKREWSCARTWLYRELERDRS